MIIDYHMHLRDEHEELAHRASAVEPFVTAARLAGVDFSAFPHVKQWLTAALQRPAAVKAAPKRAA